MGRTANDKSPGSDGLPVELFKEAGESGINMMHKICTDVWNTGKWPREWMESIFITIPKKGDNKECTNHYTTIFFNNKLTNATMCTVLERHRIE